MLSKEGNKGVAVLLHAVTQHQAHHLKKVCRKPQ